MLADSKLPKRFWAKALFTAVYRRNRSPTRALAGITAYQAWTGEKPCVNHLKVFGCATYAMRTFQVISEESWILTIYSPWLWHC